MENKLKIDTKRITIIGFGFFVILMAWHIYNTYCPLMLEYLLVNQWGFDSESHQGAYIIGIIMALDNLFALFILPIFGKLSDKTNTRFGKRMPYILIGLIATAIVFPFIAIVFINESLIGLILMMLLFLIIMNIYRTPVVSLMPDITPKPLRSKANGLINLIGYIGAIIGGVLAIVFKYDTELGINNVILYPFMIGALLCVIIAIVLKIAINENKLVEEHKKEIEEGEKLSATIEEVKEVEGETILSKIDKKNLAVVLVSSFLWYMAFNSVETFVSYFSDNYMNGTSTAGTASIIMVFASLIAFIPGGNLSMKIGRKKTVNIGILLMIIGYGLITALSMYSILTEAPFSALLFTLTTPLIGVGWAFINVNSYPMIVEMSCPKTVGKFTGYYYTAVMIAQTVTPIFVGLLITNFVAIGGHMLYPYATLMSILALISMSRFKSIYDQKENAKGLEAFDQD